LSGRANSIWYAIFVTCYVRMICMIWFEAVWRQSS
jgi:hypothetical protein